MWFDLALNPEIVKFIYKNEYPSLAGCNVTSVKLNWDGPSVDILVILKDFPANPPEKWAKLSYNTVLMTLHLSVVQSVKISGWDTENAMDIDIVRSDQGVLRFFAKNSYTEIDILSNFLRIDITAYTREL